MLSSRERITITFIALFLVSLSALYLAIRTENRMHIRELYGRIFLTSSTLYEGIPGQLAFDRDLTTAWYGEMPVQRNGSRKPADRPSPEQTTASPPGNRLYFLMEVGLTHFPGMPPEANPLQELRIWPGYLKNEQHYRNHARPKQIRVVFFRQQLVDVDREYGFPGPPEYWAETIWTLEDKPEMQSLRLDFLPRIELSPRFPINIGQIWMRLEIEDYYPGQRFEHRVAITEIDFIETYRTLVPVEEN